MVPTKAQGATEYLVLLAVVLIVALVSVALLGFFPGIGKDAQVTQSEIYWKSASPIAIVESAADGYDTRTFPYLRVRNTGSYPIRITKLLAGTEYITQLWISDNSNISDYYYLAPGEEKYFARLGSFTGIPATREIAFKASGCASTTYQLCGASALCEANADTNTPVVGQAVIPNFGFEYVQYIEGQQITKREVGAKPLAIKCTS